MKVADNQPVILLILRPAPTPSVLSSWPPPPKAEEMSPAPPCSRISPIRNRQSGSSRMKSTRVRVVTVDLSKDEYEAERYRSGGRDDGGEISGLEARATNQRTIDIGLGE